MPLIIGIDPGLTKTGWGIIRAENNNISYIVSGTIKSSADQKISDRLKKLHNHISEILRIHKPNQAAIEKVFVNKNPLSSLKLGHARGALMLTLSLQENMKIYEYASTEIKKAVVGAGRADKKQVSYMVKQLLPKTNIKTEDEADALAAAICHYAISNQSYRL